MPVTKWRPIIIALGVTGGVLIIVCLLVACACIKARQRKQQRLDRKNSLRMSRTSLRASKMSIISSDRRARLPEDMKIQSRRRPPLAKTIGDHSFLDISGVTTDDSTDDSIAKAKMQYSNRPYTPASTMNYSSHKPETSSYFDSELGPTHRGSFDNLAETPSPRHSRSPDQFFPPRVENEIANIAARPMFDYKNQGFTDDLRSLDRSQLDVGGSASAKPRPPLGWTFGDAKPHRSHLDSSGSLAPSEGERKPRPPVNQNLYPEAGRQSHQKPRPPIGQSKSRPPLGSVSTLGETGHAPYHPKSRPPLQSSSSTLAAEAGYPAYQQNHPKARPPLNSSSTIGEEAVNPNPSGRRLPSHQQQHQRAPPQQQPYSRDWNRSRDTLGSTSSGRSLEDRPRPKETDM